jgi:hypothetical protein
VSRATGANINGPPFRSAGIAGIGLCARTCHARTAAATEFHPAPGPGRLAA